MKDIILVGGGGHCKAAIDVIEQECRFNIIGIVDKSENLGQNVLGYKIICDDSELINLVKSCDNALITIGQISSPLSRINLFDKLLQFGFNLPVIVSPRAYVSNHSAIGVGSIIMHDASSRGATNYLNLAREVLQKNNQTEMNQEDKIIDFDGESGLGEAEKENVNNG